MPDAGLCSHLFIPALLNQAGSSLIKVLAQTMLSGNISALTWQKQVMQRKSHVENRRWLSVLCTN